MTRNIHEAENVSGITSPRVERASPAIILITGCRRLSDTSRARAGHSTQKWTAGLVGIQIGSFKFEISSVATLPRPALSSPAPCPLSPPRLHSRCLCNFVKRCICISRETVDLNAGKYFSPRPCCKASPRVKLNHR